ncbi:hypothetical protein L7F22_067801 [Adiantum nelumboides]|nr:hypothetical protein [Adiantum nelumboides]
MEEEATNVKASEDGNSENDYAKASDVEVKCCEEDDETDEEDVVKCRKAPAQAKSARLKQAKEEAEREVAEYRAQREAEFRKKLSESSGDSGSTIKRLEAETNEKIEQLNQEASKVSPEVVELLIKYVTTVKN